MSMTTNFLMKEVKRLMKIIWGNICMFKYNKNSGYFYKNNHPYVYIDSCKICNESYLTNAYNQSNFCSRSCSKSGKYNPLYGKKYTIEEKNKRSESCRDINKGVKRPYLIERNKINKLKKENHPQWKGGVSEKNIPFYDTYSPQIEYAEEVRRNPEDGNILEVKCIYCSQWYIPKRTEVVCRIKSLNGVRSGESRFYCSDKCKQECPIFNKQLYQENHPNKPENNRPYQQEWSKIVYERENYTCEICGNHGNIGHHILPVKPYPHLQADVDNGVCLCSKCHHIVHKIEGCKTGQLARMVC